MRGIIYALASAVVLAGSALAQAPNMTKIKADAEAGSADAQGYLAYCYLNGQGVEKNDAESVKWFLRAAEGGNVLAQVNLGILHMKGVKGAAKDDAGAVAWFRKAAESGNPFAMAQLAFAYESGYGVATNIEQAMAWYTKAGENGDLRSQKKLFVEYATGEKVKENAQEALKWCEMAAKQGDTDAKKYLPELRKQAFLKQQSNFSKESIDLGRKIVEENAAKKEGYSSAQLKEMKSKLAGQMVTFSNGRLSSVTKLSNGNVTVRVGFSAAGAGLFSSTFYVEATAGDEMTKKVMQALDEGAKIKSLSGKAVGSEYGSFELAEAKIVPEEMPSLEAEYDPATVTGPDIVKLNAKKQSGLSSAKLKALKKAVAGREFTFTDGRLSSVTKLSNGNVTVRVGFSAAGAGLFSSTFYVEATARDESMKKLMVSLDEGSKVKSLSGKAIGSEYGSFELSDARIVPEK